MAKPPPFRFKPAKPSPKGDIETAQLEGTAETDAIYSDVFVVTNEAATNMASLFFYQRRMSDREVVFGGTEVGLRIPKAKCVGRIVMSAVGAQKLLEAMAKNRGFTLTPLNEEKEKE